LNRIEGKTIMKNIDETKLNAFMGRVIGDVASANHAFLSYLGDRLGLFKAMANQGPLTSEAVARRAGLSERFVREWLGGMVAGEYVTCDGAHYTLPDEHAVVLADEEGPAFLGAFFGFNVTGCQVAPKILDAFRTGRGVAQDAFPAEAFETMERATAPTYRHFLVQQFLPAVPGLKDKLDAGARVLDVGCGGGRACLAIAKAFPKARVRGYDVHPPNIERARAAARAEGLADRVTFEARDCTALPRGELDLVLAMDVVHDAVGPVALLGAMRAALAPGGVCFVQEFNVSSEPGKNVNPLAKLLYASSASYCLHVSLAHEHGAGLGACMGTDKLQELAAKAGFTQIDRVALEHPVFSLYALR
jgi:2-polyprenyl-3-methyl-5-hydroxy-6-metoxy-1,4-benzoquinol methylase